MGNEGSNEGSTPRVQKPKHQDELLLENSKDYLKQFVNKWLYQVTLRPIVITNTLSAMNKSTNINSDDKFKQYISKFDKLAIHHSAIQISLINESNKFEHYIIFPGYNELISDLCEKGEDITKKKIKFPVCCFIPYSVWSQCKINANKDNNSDGWTCPECTYFNNSYTANCEMCSALNPQEVEEQKGNQDADNDDNINPSKKKTTEEDKKFILSLSSENVGVYGKNYGYIKDAIYYQSGISLTLSFDGMFRKILFENKEFMEQCILPKELLVIIINEYIGDTTHHNITEFRLFEPFVELERYEKEKIANYDLICYRLKDDEKEDKCEYSTGVNVFGKYFSCQTMVNIGSDYEDGELISYCPYVSKERKQCIGDFIVGKVYCQN